MKLFLRYLASRRRVIAAFALFTLFFFSSFLLWKIDLRAVGYPAALCILFGLIFLTADFLSERKRHAVLDRAKRAVGELQSVLPPPQTVIEEDYSALLSLTEQKIGDIRAEEQEKYRETVDYYTVWAHQIKTPIAAMKLALEKEDSPLCRRLSSDLFRIGQYVGMVLAYLRLDSESSDYLFREYPLDGIIRSSVRRFAPEFIDRRLKLDYAGTDVKAVTDEKWLSFVLEQLISNALKYTRTGSIGIRVTGQKVIEISDTGIGIAPEDLPRIFEKGFTGCNGRTDRAASGIGLWLCRRICDSLGIRISAVSEIDRGTTVFLDLAEYPLRAE